MAGSAAAGWAAAGLVEAEGSDSAEAVAEVVTGWAAAAEAADSGWAAAAEEED